MHELSDAFYFVSFFATKMRQKEYEPHLVTIAKINILGQRKNGRARFRAPSVANRIK